VLRVRCCRSWDEERSSLVSQIEALRKEARLYVASNKGNGAGGLAGDGSGGSAGGSGGADGEGGEGSPRAVAALKKALDEAKENEVRSCTRCCRQLRPYLVCLTMKLPLHCRSQAQASVMQPTRVGRTCAGGRG
jgi:hypothetical protein